LKHETESKHNKKEKEKNMTNSKVLGTNLMEMGDHPVTTNISIDKNKADIRPKIANKIKYMQA